MNTEPKIEFRPARPYAAVRMQVPIPFGEFLDPAWGKIAGWLAGQGITAFGPAIIRYFTTDMSAKLDIEVGFILEQALQGGEGITTGEIPAGKYATLFHTGSYEGDGVYLANAALVDWAVENGVKWATTQKEGVEWWQSRVEWYFSDPETDPDPEKYETELTFMVDADE